MKVLAPTSPPPLLGSDVREIKNEQKPRRSSSAASTCPRGRVDARRWRGSSSGSPVSAWHCLHPTNRIRKRPLLPAGGVPRLARGDARQHERLEDRRAPGRGVRARPRCSRRRPAPRLRPRLTRRTPPRHARFCARHRGRDRFRSEWKVRDATARHHSQATATAPPAAAARPAPPACTAPRIVARGAPGPAARSRGTWAAGARRRPPTSWRGFRRGRGRSGTVTARF